MKPEPSMLLKTGQPLHLSCRVQGSPVISIAWFKDGCEMGSAPSRSMCFDGLIASLDIDECSVEDGGQYVCMASSEAGSDQCSSSVTVKGWFCPFWPQMSGPQSSQPCSPHHFTKSSC